MFPKETDLISTQYCTLEVMNGVTVQKRLIACPSPDGDRWCVRSQQVCFDDHGGGRQAHPFSFRALIRDAFNHRKDYTLTRDQAVFQLSDFEISHPVRSRESFPETHYSRQVATGALALHYN